MNDIIITGTCSNCGVEYHIHAKRETGFSHKGKPIVEGDMFLEEIEDDGGDTRAYHIVKWLKEWAMFSMLSPDELKEYEDTNIEHFDIPLQRTYIIEQSYFEKLYFKGNVLEKPELLFYENLKY